MSILFYVCVVFVCGMMAHRFVDHLEYQMDFYNSIGMIINGCELVALGYIFKVLSSM